MSIVSQYYKNLTEKIITNAATLVFNKDNTSDYVTMINTLESNINELARKSLIESLEDLDLQFKQSLLRKGNYYTKGRHERYIMTIFGEIRFEREYYIPKKGGAGFFYVDKELGLPSRDYYDPTIKAMLLDELAKSSFSKAASIVSNKIAQRYEDTSIKISRQTVHNIFVKFDLDVPASIGENIEIIESETLNVILDEKYIAIQTGDSKVKNHKVMVQHAVVYTSRKLVHRNRYSLLNKRVFSNIGRTSNLTDAINTYIDQHFCHNSIKNIVFAGDGASWIKSAINDIGAINEHQRLKVLDPFHLGQSINRLTLNPGYRLMLRDYIRTNDKEKFNVLCDQIIFEEEHRLKSIDDNMKYIQNNWAHIQNINSELFISCPMESQISHNLAKVFARDPKAYKVENLIKLLKLRDAYLNRYDIKKLYLNSVIIKNSSEVNVINYRGKTNIPYLDNNPKTRTTKMLKNLIN